MTITSHSRFHSRSLCRRIITAGLSLAIVVGGAAACDADSPGRSTPSGATPEAEAAAVTSTTITPDVITGQRARDVARQAADRDLASAAGIDPTDPATRITGGDGAAADDTPSTPSPETPSPAPGSPAPAGDPEPTNPAIAPAVTSLTGPNVSRTCGGARDWDRVELYWETSGAEAVELHIDGERVMWDLPASGGSWLPFECGTDRHTYTVVASGPGGTAERSIEIRYQPTVIFDPRRIPNLPYPIPVPQPGIPPMPVPVY